MDIAVVFAGKSVAIPAISFLVRKAFNYLDKYHKSDGMEELKNRLVLAMPKIQAVFDVLNPDHVREQSHALDTWLWHLRAAIDDAENAIDELEYYELQEKAEERKVSDWGSSLAKIRHKVVKSVKCVRFVDTTCKNYAHRDSLKRLRKAVGGLDRCAAEVVSFLAIVDHLKGSSSTSQQLVNYDHETSSELSASIFVGREKEKEKIIGWITNTSTESADHVLGTNNIPIISVVGHGGMGKTTLAQSICTEDAMRNNFEVIWETVSTNFDATSVTRRIVESVTREKPSSDHLEPLQKLLKERLNSTDFLLVLDDVWEDQKEGEWAKLFAPLRNMNTRSKILLTTRMQSVAYMATGVMGVERSHYLTLQELENDENIELFNHHVSSGLHRQDCENFETIGEQIARKLGGCPMVTKVIAGHLRDNVMIEYWNGFLYEGLKHFIGTEEGIIRVLRLSYYSLPTELQMCFRYCSIFPQDYQFEKKKLIQMWMGSGLISQHASGSHTFEDIGERILVQLNKKSFFDLKSRVYGTEGTKQEYYVMHDLMHDLARNVSSGECARITHPDMFEDNKCTVRHMCIGNIHNFSVDEVKKISNFKHLRTIIIDDSKQEIKKNVVCVLEKVIENLKYLRLLYSRLHDISLTVKCGKLKHLRYMRLQFISPEGICGVVRLYHLMLFYCDNICFRNVWHSAKKQVLQVRYLGNLDRLRYVSYGSANMSICQPQRGLGEFSIFRVTHLQELNNYRVEESTGNKLSAVKSLRTLRTLQVSGLENVKNPEEAKDIKLNEIICLKSLSLNWSVSDTSSGQPNYKDELVLDHLQPHCNVRELEISGYSGVKLPFWIEDHSFSSLVLLKLHCCVSWERLPSLGNLVWLRHIKLEELSKLQQIGHLSSNTSMEFLPPRLETLQVYKCPTLSELPVLPTSLMSLRISHVGLTKLHMIDTEGSETKPSQLMNIHVTNCYSLTSLEGSLLEQKMHMGALQCLFISRCDNLEFGSIAFEGMTIVTDLDIRLCPKFSIMETFRKSLTYLKYLDLVGCSGLVSLASSNVFTSFKSLQFMTIYGCKNLVSLGGLGCLQSLTRLRIRCCSKLVEVGPSLNPHAPGGEEDHLVQICRLEVDLISLLLVEPLNRLRRTIELVITDGSDMQSLPEQWLICNRQFLRCLRISWAGYLKSLPLSMRDLSSLEQLCIKSCHSELLDEIRQNSNSELNKISHIRRVEIEQSSYEPAEYWFSIMGRECDKETYDRLRGKDIGVLTSWLNQPNDDEGVESPLPSSQPWWRKYYCCVKNAS